MPAPIRRPLLSFFWLALLASGSLRAADGACQEESADCAVISQWNFSLGVGFGSRSNPVDTQRDIPLVLVPKLSYYGKRFFIESLEFGVTLAESDSQSFSLVAAPGYDRVFFHRNDLQNFFVSGAATSQSATTNPNPPTTASSEVQPPPTAAETILAQDRDVTYLVGPEWNFDFGPLIGQFDALYEVTGEHGGTEIRAALALPVLGRASNLSFTAGATWKSAETVTYYYGAEGVYEPGSALNPFVKLSYALPLSENWEVSAFAHFEWLDSAIENSPIIFEDRVITAFAGVFYSF